MLELSSGTHWRDIHIFLYPTEGIATIFLYDSPLQFLFHLFLLYELTVFLNTFNMISLY